MDINKWREEKQMLKRLSERVEEDILLRHLNAGVIV